MKSILLSIHPKWCELIASGKKTVEIRKTRPKIEPPFKCYIYCTINGTTARERDRNIFTDLRGKVIGEFICDDIIYAGLGYYHIFKTGETQIEPLDLLDYADDKRVYGWHISHLVIYDSPKELNEFFVYCERCDKRPIACEYLHEESNECVGYYSECMCDFKRPIKRPPQSWCYVEELEDLQWLN